MGNTGISVDPSDNDGVNGEGKNSNPSEKNEKNSNNSDNPNLKRINPHLAHHKDEEEIMYNELGRGDIKNLGPIDETNYEDYLTHLVDEADENLNKIEKQDAVDGVLSFETDEENVKAKNEENKDVFDNTKESEDSVSDETNSTKNFPNEQSQTKEILEVETEVKEEKKNESKNIVPSKKSYEIPNLMMKMKKEEVEVDEDSPKKKPELLQRMKMKLLNRSEVFNEMKKSTTSTIKTSKIQPVRSLERKSSLFSRISKAKEAKKKSKISSDSQQQKKTIVEESSILRKSQIKSIHDEVHEEILQDNHQISKRINPFFDPKYEFKGTLHSLDPSTDVVVLELGHLYTKYGFGGEIYPKKYIHSVISKSLSSPQKSYGELNRNMSECIYPFPQGIPRSMKELSEFIENTINKDLGSGDDDDFSILSEYALCCPVPPSMSFLEKIKLVDLFLGDSSFQTPGLILPTTSACTLFQSGRVTGVVLESGFSVTHSVGIYNGQVISHGIKKLEFGGGDITDYLGRLIGTKYNDAFQRSDGSLTMYEKSRIREFKHQNCYVAEDFVRELHISEIKPQEIRKEYILPDGRVVGLTDELFRSSELLFRPMKEKNYEKFPGIHEIVVESIEKSFSGDIDLKTVFYENIIIGGGNLKFLGLKNRLEKEIGRTSIDYRGKIQVVKSHEKDMQFSSYMGASKLSSVKSLFCSMAISREEYDEIGRNVIYRKCI